MAPSSTVNSELTELGSVMINKKHFACSRSHFHLYAYANNKSKYNVIYDQIMFHQYYDHHLFFTFPSHSISSLDQYISMVYSMYKKRKYMKDDHNDSGDLVTTAVFV